MSTSPQEAGEHPTLEVLASSFALTVDGQRIELSADVLRWLRGEIPLALEVIEPFHGDCPRCKRPVMAVVVDGVEAVLEPREIVEQYECQLCRQIRNRGHSKDSLCERCDDRGVLGEPLPLRGVVVGEDGFAREWRRGQPFRFGDSLYALHSCH